MSRLSLYLLGPPRVERDGEPIEVDTRKAIALLAYLAVTGERHERAALINLLWPDSDPAHGHAVFRRTLSALKSALADEWLDIKRDTVFLHPSGSVWCDVDQFHSFLVQREAHGHVAAEFCPECLPLLTQAVALHRGDFLAGFSLKDSADFDDWQFLEAESLRRELGVTLELLVRGNIADLAYEQAAAYARKWLALDRLNETAHAQLMCTYAWSGQVPAALRQYQECESVLRQQLGVAPHESLAALYEAIRAGHIPAPPPALSGAPPAKALPATPQFKALRAPTPADALDYRRIVTVLFVQASAAHSLAPEAEMELSRRIATLAGQVVAKYGGSLARAIGSSILAAFGLERIRETDAELATRVALELKRDAAQAGMCLGAGICTGEVCITPGSADGGPIEMAGRAVDLAVRLAGQAEPGQILAGQATYRLTRSSFSFIPRTVSLMGAPGDCYQVGHLLSQPTKTRGIEGLQAKLTGRDAEMALLQEALALACQGQGRFVSIVGEAGVGKSRLAAELKNHARAAATPPLWLEGRCLDLGRAVSYAPFLDILRGFFALTADDAGQVSPVITAGLQEMADRGDLTAGLAAEMAPLLDGLLVSPAKESAEVLREPPDQLRRRTFLALRDFFAALARRQPLVLVLEDLHWADELSLDLIALLMDNLGATPTLLLCLYRPGQEYGTRRLSEMAARKCVDCCVELRLRDLSGAQSRQMIGSLLGEEVPLPNVCDLVLDRAQGNPFFIEETVRALIEAGSITRQRGRWCVRSGVAPCSVPDSVQSVILSRVDRCDAEAQQVLQTAAVIGRLFQPRLLQHAMPQVGPPGAALDALEERSLIYRERSLPETEYSFIHVLTQQAVYDRIPDALRRRLHDNVAGALEVLYRDNLSEQYERLAYHHERAGNLQTAIGYLSAAGEKAKLQFANEAAIAHLTRALDLLATLPGNADRDRRELELLLAMGIPVAAGKGMSASDMFSVHTRAADLAQRAGDQAQLVRALQGLFRFHHTRGQWPQAHAISGEMMRVAQMTPDPDALLEASRARGIAAFYTPDLPLCLSNMTTGLALYDSIAYKVDYSINLHDPAISYLSYSAWALWLLGCPDQAVETCQRLVQLGRTLTNPADLAFALYVSGFLHLLRGELPEVERYATEGRKIAEERNYPMWLAFATALEGLALARKGSAEGGAVKLREALEQFDALGMIMLRTCYLGYLALALGQSGKAEEGMAQLDEAFTIIAGGGERTFEAELYRLRGELLLLQGGAPDDVEQSFRRALGIARSQGAKAWELRTATSLARFWQGEGRDGALTLLRPVYSGFTEGFDTVDMRSARALLDELAG